jgi:hypothetical protein
LVAAVLVVYQPIMEHQALLIPVAEAAVAAAKALTQSLAAAAAQV